MAPKDVRIPDPWDLRVYVNYITYLVTVNILHGKKDLVDVIKDRKIMRLAWIIGVDSISAL